MGNTPFHAKCYRCKMAGRLYSHTPTRHPSLGWKLSATGRTKTRHTYGRKHEVVLAEYRCADCGHVGWTNNSRLVRLALDVF